MAVNFVDRVPTRPNRYKVTPEDGSAAYHVVLERADEPSVIGTPLNAENLNNMQKDVGLFTNKTVYVSTVGSDNTGEGTNTAPYASITKALSMIPKNLNGFSVYINVASGTYNEDVIINGFHGGVVFLTGASGTSVTLNSLTIGGGTFCSVDIALTLTTNTNMGLFVYQSSTLYSASSITLNGGYNVGAMVNASRLYIAGTLIINNAISNALLCANTGIAHINVIAGIGSTGVALVCHDGSTISYNQATISYPTNTHTRTGGRIYSGSQTSIPSY